ncbi:hypothetical protein BDV12DRAFT_189870 [Aspergillus spectabilis]
MAPDAYRMTDFGLSLEERIRSYQASVVADPKYSGFDTQMLRVLEYVGAHAETKTTMFQFEVADFMCNKDGVLHGGAASTMFDNISSTSLFTIGKPGYWDNLGVSRSLSIWFHHPIPAGARIRLVNSVVDAGQRMATVRSVMKSPDGKTCASCVHEKYLSRRGSL